MTALIKLNSVIKSPLLIRKLFFSISYVDVLSIHNMEKKSMPNIDINILSIPYVEKLSI